MEWFVANDEHMIPSSTLVVDDDQVVLKQMVAYLLEAGVSLVEHASTGGDAWKKISSRPYDFFVLDWKLPDVSGMALFNRIRRMRGHGATPLLVVSGLIKRDDFRLLEEFPCTSLLEKPFTRGQLLKKVSELTTEFNWYKKNASLVDELSALVATEPGKVTSRLLKSVLPGAPNPVPLAIMAARKLRESGSLENAAKLLQQVLTHAPKNIQAMTELARILHLTGNHKEALAFLKEANVMSPSNVSRLCLMGEAELNLCNPEHAARYFRSALGVDGQDKGAREGFAVAKEVLSIAKRPENDHIPRTFASLLNVMGVALVRSGSYEHGIKKYHAAMRFLHLDRDSAKLAFNLGLGFLRWKKPREAYEWFYKSARLGGVSYLRAGPYLSKLKSFVPEQVSGAQANEAPGSTYAVPDELVAAAQRDEFEEESILASSAGNPHFPDTTQKQVTDVDASVLNTLDDNPEIDETVLADLADLEGIT